MDRNFCCKIVLCILLGYSLPVMGKCPLAEFFIKQNKAEQAFMAMQTCAQTYNDDESQYLLAQIYEKNKQPEPMLYYYQLAAESGHAEAQVHLSELLKQYDTSKEGREQLLSYQKKLFSTTENNEKTFKGEFMHPYTLLLLAAEPTEKKWYYPSSMRTAPTRTLSVLRAYKITDKQKQKALLSASKWKTRKLLETAKEVAPSEIYPDLVKRLKNSATQSQAMSELKQYVEKYVRK